MPIIGWIRDLFGIQKDMYETKKTRLEIEKIEDAKREKLIAPASLEDVIKYDPKVDRLRIEILKDINPRLSERIDKPNALKLIFYALVRKVWFWALILLIIVAIALTVYFLLW